MSNSFTVGCFGYGGNVALIEHLREDLELAGITLKTCHEYPSATVRYDPSMIHGFIDSCDIILLPARHRLQPAKSVNRLALAWSRRKACVVSPLPSYLDYVVPNGNALVAESKEDWLSHIFKLRDDPSFRSKIADAGYGCALKRLHPFSLADKFFNALDGHGMFNDWPQSMFVQIIVPHYSPRLDYLAECVEAALSCKGPARDVLVVSSSKIDPRMAMEAFNKSIPNLRLLRSNERLSFSEANNLGIKNADPRTTHFLLLNDDAILSDDCLARMASTMAKGEDSFILNPYSNCDKSWLHNDKLWIENSGKDLHPNMSIDQFTRNELDGLRKGFCSDRIEDADKIPSYFCAFYCTLIPKKTIDHVGYLNTQFKNGGEDLDYCERAKRFGFGCYWDSLAKCFHFGGKSRKVSESENYIQHHEEDRINNELVRKRWPKSKKRIGIWTGPAWEPWSLENYRKDGSGIGGSELVEGCLAEAAAAEGHHVTLYGAVEEPIHQYGVDLVPWNHFMPDEEYFDLFIASRNINCIDGRLKAKRVLAHIHDIWLISGQHVSDFHRSRIDKFICLSPWHKEFVKSHHNLPEDKIGIIPNGIRYEWFEGFGFEDKLNVVEWGRLHWSSSPDRGLDNLLYLLPWILDKCPDVKVHVFYGFHNWLSAARSRNNKEEMAHIERMRKQIDDMGEHVVFHDRVNQVKLSEEWRKAWLWMYPTLFTETSCLTAREAQMSYTPVACSNVAALQTTVGEFGHLVKHHPYSKEGREEFLVKAIEMYKNKDKWAEAAVWSNMATAGGEYKWENIWKIWEKYI